MKKNQVSSIDFYLNQFSEPQKSTLTKMRQHFIELLPEVKECISYGIPAFKYKGTIIGGFSATKKHCSYYPFSGSTLRTLNGKLTQFQQTKSALHFPHDKALSKKILKLLISARIDEVKTKNTTKRIIKPGGVDKYISNCPQEVQYKLLEMRSLIRNVAPKAVETTSYFDMPGYSIEGYEYNGMFVWFSFKAPYLRLHVRPKALISNKKDLSKYVHTKAIVCFSVDRPLPKLLIKKLVKASLKDMKESAF